MLASLIGFVIAAIWVYFISSEAVSALTMLGVVSKIPQEARHNKHLGQMSLIQVIGLTLARRGVPRMAFTATFAAPLFSQ